MTRWTQEELDEHRMKAIKKKPSKYGNKKTVIDGQKFDSKGEGERYIQLRYLQKIGEIKDLKCQVSFELAPEIILNGKKRQPLRYRADFTYVENGMYVVEDFKGFRTAEYKIKRHLMKSVHGIEIRETSKK